MSNSDDSNQYKLTFTVPSETAAQELDAAWREILSGKKPVRPVPLQHDETAILARAQSALAIIETVIRENPTTGQARRLVHFIAGLYNGFDYPFDLTDLRALDTELANACLDYLNYDRLGKLEVYRHLSGGEQLLLKWLGDYGLRPW